MTRQTQSRVTIRRAVLDDAQAMIELLNPIIRAGNLTSMDREVTADEQREFINTFPQAGVLNVAVEQHSARLIGMQDVMPAEAGDPGRRVGDISTFIALDMLGRGIGSALMMRTLRDARAIGITAVRAVIRKDNSPAVAFYRSHGFQEATDQRAAARDMSGRRRVVLVRNVE